MLKKEYTITMNYEFHPERKGAKYKIGEKFKNFGEFCESVAKHERGLAYEVNPNTAWNTGRTLRANTQALRVARRAWQGYTLRPLMKSLRFISQV